MLSSGCHQGIFQVARLTQSRPCTIIGKSRKINNAHGNTVGGKITRSERPNRPRPPFLLDALVAVLVLIVLVLASFLLFGDEAPFGPNQVALTLAATLAAGIAWKNGHTWDDIRQAVVE